MKKLFRLLFVAAMFLSGCNSGNGNGSTKIPEGYTLSNSWPTSVINLFLGEGRATVPDAGVSSVLYCVYDKTDTNCASIDIMIAGNYESTYIDILKNANWVVSNTKVEKIGYECNDVNQTVEVDVLYIEDYKYTYIDIYRYEDVKEYDPVAGLTPSTIWPAQQISDFLDSETVVPAAEVKNTCFYGEFDGEDSFFRVAVEGDQLVSYSSTLLFNGYSVDVEDELLFSDEDETIEISLKKVQGYTYIDICDVGSIESSNWPTAIIDAFLGVEGVVPAATLDEVEYTECEATGEYCAYIEIIAEGNLESSYSATLSNAGWDVDDETYYDEYGICAIDPNLIAEVDFFYEEGNTYFYIYRYEDLYGGGGDTSDYGTLENPLTVTEALAVAAIECTENYSITNEPIYCYGEVTSFETSTKSYKNVYITDGDNTVHIYTLGYYDGYEMAEGDIIEIYGYMKNYSGELQFATNNSTSTPTYVEIVDYENGGGGEEDYEYGPWPTSLINSFLGTNNVVPAATTDDVYYLESEADDDYAACFQIVVEGDLETSYATTLSNAGWDVDDETYYDTYGICCIDPDEITEVDFFAYEGDTYFYIYRYEDLYGGGGDTSNYGTLENPLTVTEALEVAGDECSEDFSYTAEPIYCYGEVQEFSDGGTYYKNVYISDGTNEVMIYKLDFLSGYNMMVGDIIEIYGYMKNYQGTLEFAPNGETTVTIVDYDDGEDDYEYGPWPTSLIEDLVGGSDIVPAATTDDVSYDFFEADEAHSAFVEIICDGNLEDSYKALLEEANWTIDDSSYDLYGYFAYDANEKAYIQFFFYEDETCFFIYNYDDVAGGGDSGEYVTEWPGDAIVEFLGSEASTVPSFEANEYYVEEFEEDETYAACLMICCEEDVSSDYFTTIKDLSWTYWTSQDEGYTAEDPDHTVFLQFGFDEEYGFCLYIYRWSDVKEETDITTTYGTVSNSLITTGDCLNVAAFSIKDGTGYTDYTAKIGNNEYKAYAYSTDDFIQIKSKTLDSGVVTTKSSGNVASVSIDWNSKSVKDNNSYATIEIYASNTAFSYEDMFDEDTSACVKVATLVCSTSCTFVFNTDANYQYIGIRSVEGAAYINNIYIQYK